MASLPVMNLFLPAIFTVEVIFAYVIWGQELAENYVPFGWATDAVKLASNDATGRTVTATLQARKKSFRDRLGKGSVDF